MLYNKTHNSIANNRRSDLMKCTKCGNENIRSNELCGQCYSKQYYASNRDKRKESSRKYRYTHGTKPASENKQCTSFLGVYVAEQVPSKVFKNVEKMPTNNKGFDFFCNKGKKIDVKSACTHTRNAHGDSWIFHIKHNNTADYFLCLAFDSRENLNPLHIWLIPGEIINHQMRTSIAKSTLHKWDEYKLDITKTIKCCTEMKTQHKLQTPTI